MKKTILVFTIQFFLMSLYAQSPFQLQRVLKETKVAKLQDDANIYLQQAEEQKALADRKAIENGWPINMESDSSFAELIRLDQFGLPVYNITANNDAAISTSTRHLNPGGSLGLNLEGTGMIIGEWDEGAVLTTHQEFNNTGSCRVTLSEVNHSSVRYHSTHVAGTLIAGGVEDYAKGMAPNAQIHSYNWFSDQTEMAIEASNGLLLSNHSYGIIAGWHNSMWWGNVTISDQEDYKFGFYDGKSQSWDNIAYNAPYYLIVKCAMNDRNEGPSDGAYPLDGPYDCIPTYGVSKNILTVGAVEDVIGGYTGNPADVVMTDFSDWGPSDDGRIKPDICGNGSLLWSTGIFDSIPEESYMGMSGTSMASPNVAGSLLLLQEHYHNLFSDWMQASTLKALALQTADECGPDPGPDYMFGWGLLNAKTAANVISNRDVNSIIKEDVYNGSNYSISVHAIGYEPLRATLVWTDPPGTPPAASLDPPDIMLVNDLDMTIDGSKTTYYPYKLDKDHPSFAATTGDNDVDNVEQIHIANPTAGTYTIHITHEGSISNGSQTFSLIVTGINILEPAVITYEPSSITANAVSLNGEVASNNGNNVTERGFVYSNNANPDINDTKVIVGSGLGVFSTTISNLSPQTIYHARAYAINSSGIGYGVDKDFTTNSITTTWNGNSWDNGLPNENTHVVINGAYTTSDDLSCLDFTVNSGKTFNLDVNDGLTVNGDFTNNGTFNILSNASGIGSLITLGSVNNNGSFHMQRYIADSDWHLIAVPMNNIQASSFSGDYLQYWNEPDTSYYEITDPNYNLELGKGYALWSSPKKSKIYTLTGTPHSGNLSIDFSWTDFDNDVDDAEGVNLMGNPFPSSIDWSTLDEGLYGSVYYWNGTNYSSWNSGGGTNNGTPFIPPGQGFYIATTYTGHLNLGNANRTHLGTNSYWKSKEFIHNSVLLSSSGNGYKDELFISFNSDANETFDKKYDALKLKSGNPEIPEIYSLAGNRKLSIDRRPTSNIIQLGFSCQTNGTYDISIKQIDGLSSVEIEDTKLNVFQNLNESSYSFEWSNLDSEERFVLHLKAAGTNDINDKETKVYAVQDQVFISLNENNDFNQVKVFDLTGRSIYQSTLTSATLQSFFLNNCQGIFLVKLIGKNQNQTEKVILK